MRFIYGTSNRGKIEQVKDFFKTTKESLEIISLQEIGFSEEIIEDGKTFEENSLIKAKAIKNFCLKHDISEIIITDDAGLLVDALDGRPGVLSARYAGDHASQEETLDKLLRELKDVPKEERTAQFVCVLTAVLPNGKVIVKKGETNGTIADKKGTMGKLTYGPVFIPEGQDRVMNDFEDEELAHTHREKAFIDMISCITDELDQER